MKKILYYLTYASVWLLSLLPLWALYGLSDFIYLIIFYAIKYRRKLVFKNMSDSFPEKDEQEIRDMERRFYHWFCDYFLEAIKLLSISDEELNRVTDFIKQQAIPVEDNPEITNTALPSDSQKEAKNAAAGDGEASEEDSQDELLDDAIRLVLDLGQASASMLQRRFRIGYNRAARLVETMEELGIVGPATGSKPRELLLSRDEVEYRFLKKDNFSDSQ